MTLRDYIGEPRRDWSDRQWLQYAYIQYHSPWINEKEKEYYKDIINRLSNNNRPS